MKLVLLIMIFFTVCGCKNYRGRLDSPPAPDDPHLASNYPKEVKQRHQKPEKTLTPTSNLKYVLKGKEKLDDVLKDVKWHLSNSKDNDYIEIGVKSMRTEPAEETSIVSDFVKDMFNAYD